jgi:phage head maturation protease
MQTTNLKRAILQHYSGPCVAAWHHNGYETADGRRRIPDAVKAWRRDAATCAGCQQRILEVSEMATRGTRCFHAVPCVARFDAAQRRTPRPPQIIGKLVGIAVPFNQRCSIAHADRTEVFDYDAFNDSIARNETALTIDHHTTVPGRLTLFAGRELRFRFEVFDTPLGRRTLATAQRGGFSGVSIAFREERSHGEGWPGITRVDQATLTQVSLCESGRPSWYGTVVLLEE